MRCRDTLCLTNVITLHFPFPFECCQLKSLSSLWTTSQSCQGTIALVYDCIWRRKKQTHSPYQIQITNLNIWHYNKTFLVPITGLIGSCQLTPCRWTEMHPGYIILALSWDSFSSLNKHCGKQLWPVTINQHNYVKNVFEIWRSNRMSLCAWIIANSLSSDAGMKPHKVYIWKTSQAIWHCFSSWYAFPEKDIQK